MSERKEYIFTFEGGGWNSVYAASEEKAIKAAMEEYKDSTSLNPIPSSFLLKEDNEDVYDNLLSLFY